ncbi:DNA/RNA polymerases superfamily protein [Gossypium australe]|uniref:DNA/RNA polymerases superfamily protein n=1 Tax=Gossypium australe TaxID=47621 RepID=A0A5B6VWA0_9ROSI|nr:DNA/RNA polymerases superfamily protein [Gossypium australe]
MQTTNQTQGFGQLLLNGHGQGRNGDSGVTTSMTGTVGRGQGAPGRRREDRDSSNFIACTSISYFALIDIGSTHSYVSNMVSDKVGIEIKEIVSDVTIVSLLGQSVVVNKIYRRCPLEIQGEVFLVYLMELPFGEFDLILGMD